MNERAPRILIVGASSAIAEASARLFVARGASVFLVARDPQRLAAVHADLAVRASTARVFSHVMDMSDHQSHAAMLAQAMAALGGLDVVLLAHGHLPDQSACQASPELTLRELQSNAGSAIALLTLVANLFEEQGRGSIAVISSVAGVRGRRSNYVYGAAKAALSTFVSGLRQRLASRGVGVLTVLPGFVDTPMTRHVGKNWLWAQPEAVARGIVEAISRRRRCVYLPGYWRAIMFMVRLIPESVFARLRL